ncbi:ankyrin repeat domain-containing protein [Legionella gresilensis]|uniref:ankyrin repeat domain-containing protein n=1 Tax=Legionella gresilensis TaxID=91823 RepID=UPI0010418807|nr:ankyrin repeat domain-containing protein [Legionella gresilensis]
MPTDSINFTNNDRDYDIFSNVVELGIQFWLDGELYQSHSIEAAYQGIQGYIPFRGDSENDSYARTPTRQIAQQVIVSEYTNIADVGNFTQLFQANVSNYFDSPIEPYEKGYFAIPEEETLFLKEQFMYELLLMKATQNIEVLKALLETGNKKIIAEPRNPLDLESPFWEGKANALGLAWMRVRDTLKAELEQSGKIRVRKEFSNALTGYFFGLDLDKNINQADDEVQYIDAEEIISQTQLLLTTAQIHQSRRSQMFDDEYSFDIEYPYTTFGDLSTFKSRLPPNPQDFPLHTAAYQGDTNKLKELLGKGVDPNALDQGGDFSIEDLNLIDPDIRDQVNSITVEGRSPLYLACSRASSVLEGNNPYTGRPETAQPHPNTYVDSVRLLLEYKANPLVEKSNSDSEIFTPIHLAIYSGNYQVTKLFREYQDASGKNYMHTFLEQYGCHIRDQFDCEDVKYPDTKKSIFLGGYPLLFQAAQDGDIEMIKAIFNHAKEFSSKSNRNSFFQAGNNSNESAVRDQKIKNYLNTETSDQPYDYILHAAVKSGNLEVIKLIIEKGADITKVNRFSETPLDVAQRLGHSEICSYLQEISDNTANKNNIYNNIHS